MNKLVEDVFDGEKIVQKSEERIHVIYSNFISLINILMKSLVILLAYYIGLN